MGRQIDREVLVGFIAESKGYLPEILRGIEEFRADATKADRLEESHRHIHTIKGASSMVGLSVLSHVAYQFEEALEDLAGGRIVVTDNALMLIVNALAQIEGYLDGVLCGMHQDRPFFLEATRSIRLLRGLPPEDEEATLASILGAIEELSSPEHVSPEQPAVVDAQPHLDERKPETDSAQRREARELAEVFAFEAEDHLRNISLSLPLLEQAPGDKDLLQGIRRSAHSLKGTAAMVGFHEITKLAHRMEDLLDLLYEGSVSVTGEIMTLLFASTYALEDMSANRADDLVIQNLYSLYERLLDPEPPPEARVLAVEPPGVPEPPAVIEPAEPPAVYQQEQKPPEILPSTESKPAASIPFNRGQYVRVPIQRLDELVKLVSELVITRTSFEQSMRDFAREVDELHASSERLRRVSANIESQYEASALGGGRGLPLVLSGFRSVPGVEQSALSPLSLETAQHFDELEFDRYTEFHLLSRELSETASDIHSVTAEMNNLTGDFESYLTRQGRLYSEVQDKLMRTRMLPLATLSARLQRTVRTVAAKQGKYVELVLEGESTELDKTVLEEMTDPLLHILRNAVDHGIEPPALRQVRGKSSKGTITLRAYYEGTQIVIEITDDGAGIDTEVLRTAAVNNGFISAAEAAELSDEEVRGLIFSPGFSTSPNISEVSGRGVGLDVVKATVSRLKGSIGVKSVSGQRTTLTVRLPMTLAITRALLVKTHGETFAIPIAAVTQIVRLGKEEIELVGDEPVVRVGGQVFPLVFLGKVLGLKDTPDDSVGRSPVLIMSVEGRQVALVVDHLLGGREVVVKNLGSHLRRVHGVAGATLMGDGSVVLILNPADLIREPERAVTHVRPAGSTTPRTVRETLSVMVVDDSPSVRRILSNLVRNAGWKPELAKDGLEALELLHHSTNPPDLILLDIEMPRMDGYELLGKLRAHDRYRNLPVVILTSRAGDKHRQKAFDLGATDYVVKPYQDETLLGIVRRLTQKPV
jgi:chemosensory pili system protein ChpA (sensor histidine kinase/response regulator)